MPKPNKAMQAMKHTLASSDTNQDLNEAIHAFISALKEVDPDRAFTVLDITRWAAEYKRLEGEVALPNEMFNTYSLGKYLKGSQEVLGIESQGTYGNRQVWGLKNG